MLNNSNGYRVNYLVTIGSPLGMEPIKEKLGNSSGSIEFTGDVEQWTNLADHFDPIAMDGDLNDDYHGKFPIKDVVVRTKWSNEDCENKYREIEDIHRSIKERRIEDLRDLRKLEKALSTLESLFQFHDSCGYLQTLEMSALVRKFLEEG